jgi:transposase
MKEIMIAGVDVSKSTLDIYFKPLETGVRVSNDAAGFKQIEELLGKGDFQANGILFVMEHTGQYSCQFEKFLSSAHLGYCKLSALQIKRSLGVTRGKSDRIDARRIAEYAWLRRETMKADPVTKPALVSLRSLLSLRSKLVRDRSGYMSRLKEMLASGTTTAASLETKVQQQIIKEFTAQITKLEAEIKSLLSANLPLRQSCELLMSIKGVGWIIAVYMISCTGNFERFSNARKFNCYAGLAPFKYQSGTTLNGRARVSHLANKEAKTLLNLGACCAIRHDPELKMYFNKRVEAGMRKMSCINIIRSKLVARMFAVIKRNSPYLPVQIAA